MTQTRIGRRLVGGDAPVFIIAELSANHVGKLDVALRTVEAAAKAGADAIKIQTFTPDTLTLASSAPPFIVKMKNAWEWRTLHDIYAEAMTPWEWHKEIFDAARSFGLECFSTPFDATAVQFLDDLGAPAFKIASFELNDTVLVQTAASYGKPMIMSTGMASLADIERALHASRSVGNEQIILLRCVSAYPANPASMFLRSFSVLSSLAPIVGLSDHTRDSTAAIASVALGAKVLEKHFILDRAMGGPDSFFSLEPAEFRAMVDAIRSVEGALAGPRFGPADEEVASAKYRRSLFVAKDLAPGDLLTAESVRSVRPGHGLPPRYLPAVLGRRASRAVSAGTPLTWSMVDRGSSPARARVATDDDASFVARCEDRMGLSSADATSGRVFIVTDDAGDARIAVVRVDDAQPFNAHVRVSTPPGADSAQVLELALRAAEQAARDTGATRLVTRFSGDLPRAALLAAGWLGFRPLSNGTFLCERPLSSLSDDEARS